VGKVYYDRKEKANMSKELHKKLGKEFQYLEFETHAVSTATYRLKRGKNMSATHDAIPGQTVRVWQAYNYLPPERKRRVPVYGPFVDVFFASKTYEVKPWWDKDDAHLWLEPITQAGAYQPALDTCSRCQKQVQNSLKVETEGKPTDSAWVKALVETFGCDDLATLNQTQYQLICSACVRPEEYECNCGYVHQDPVMRLTNAALLYFLKYGWKDEPVHGYMKAENGTVFHPCDRMPVWLMEWRKSVTCPSVGESTLDKRGSWSWMVQTYKWWSESRKSR
jgi:hypothetical protein